jgi:hypothetical protein
MQCFLLAAIDPHICGRLALSFLPTEPLAAISGSVKYYLTDIQSEVVRRDPEWCIRENLSKRRPDNAAEPQPFGSEEAEIDEILAYFGIACPSSAPIRIFSDKCVAQSLRAHRKNENDVYGDAADLCACLNTPPSKIEESAIACQEVDIICITATTCAEPSFTRALYSLAVHAICRQRRGGALILKMSDTFTLPTIDILALLSAFYTTVHLVKPRSSNSTGSDKYAVCQNFIGASLDYKKELTEVLSEMDETCINQYVSRLLSVDIAMNFVSRVEMCNIMMGKCQIEHIHAILLNLDKKRPQDSLPTGSQYCASKENRSWTWSTSKTHRELGYAYSSKIKYSRKTKSRVQTR